MSGPVDSPVHVVAVAAERRHRFSKAAVDEIRLLAGLGVDGDAHCGSTVQHRSRKRWTPDAPNLRQVHLMAAELLDELRAGGFGVVAGSIGENIITRGVDLIALARGTRLRFGAGPAASAAVVEITGLRNPCVQLDRFQDGLMAAVLDRDEHDQLIRRAGVMGVVVAGGVVRPGDPIAIGVPPGGDHVPLAPV